MSDHGGGDERIAEALARIPVPDYTPGFWDRLDDRLADDGDLVLVPMARSRRTGTGARRAIAVLAAAAAIVAAVVALQLAGDDGGELQTAKQPDATAPSPDGGSGIRLPSELGAPGSTATPQDAFVTWASALAEGDAAAARALVGPRTIAYYDALGSGIDDAGDGYEVWAASDGREIDVIDFGEVAGDHVASVVLRRPDDAQRFGARYAAVPLVETDSGWRVEPAAFDPEAESRLELVEPGPGEQGLEPLALDRAVRLQVQGAGVYYVGADREALSGFVPGDADDDGVVTWVPDPPLSEGVHLLIVAHLSPTVLTVSALPVEVVAGG